MEEKMKENNLKKLLAWMGSRLKTDPNKIKLDFIDKCSFLYTFKCPEGSIFLDDDYMSCTFTKRIKKEGYVTKIYSVFGDGFEGKDKKPSILHPILRQFYKRGLEAKTRYAVNPNVMLQSELDIS